MPKKETVKPGLLSRDQRIKDAMAAFREQQMEYEACLLDPTSATPPKPPSVAFIAISHYLVPTTLQRRLKEETRSQEEAHIHRQRLTQAEETALAT